MANYSEVGGENVSLLNAIINDGEYTGEATSRNSKILKSILNDTEYTDEPQSEIESLLLQLKEKVAGGSSKAELLVYGTQNNWDDGEDTETGHLVPLTCTEEEDFSTYLEYTAPTEGDEVRAGTFKVLKAFYGVVVPWVTNAQSSSGKPRGVLMYNGDNLIAQNYGALYEDEYFTTESNSEGSVGGFGAIAINFAKDDVFGLTAVDGAGYPKLSLKVYKFFDVTASTEDFFDSITDFSA